MNKDDFKKNEFADFDAFDEDDDFESDMKFEEEKTERDKPPIASTFATEDVVVEVISTIKFNFI